MSSNSSFLYSGLYNDTFLTEYINGISTLDFIVTEPSFITYYLNNDRIQDVYGYFAYACYMAKGSDNISYTYDIVCQRTSPNFVTFCYGTTPANYEKLHGDVMNSFVGIQRNS